MGTESDLDERSKKARGEGRGERENETSVIRFGGGGWDTLAAESNRVRGRGTLMVGGD